MFGKKKNQPTSSSDNPFLSARRSMNERVGLFLEKIRAWQIMSIMEFAVILALLAMLSDAFHTPKYIPYVVELDKLGTVVNATPATVAKKVDDRVMKATLASFINNIRMVTPDISLQRKAVQSVFAQVSTQDPAYYWVNKWYAVDPLTRSKEVLVSTEIQSILKQSDTTWQIEWIEFVRNHAGELMSTDTYRALMTVYEGSTSADLTPEELMKNPLSIFIKDLSWQKIVK